MGLHCLLNRFYVYGIYCGECVLYIGSTNNFERRKYEHECKLKEKNHYNENLQKLYNFGKIFNYKILKIVESSKDARQIEAELIIKNHPICNQQIPYDVKTFGESDGKSGFTITEDLRNKKRVNAPFKGKKRPEEVCQAVSNGKKKSVIAEHLDGRKKEFGSIQEAQKEFRVNKRVFYNNRVLSKGNAVGWKFIVIRKVNNDQ